MKPEQGQHKKTAEAKNPEMAVSVYTSKPPIGSEWNHGNWKQTNKTTERLANWNDRVDRAHERIWSCLQVFTVCISCLICLWRSAVLYSSSWLQDLQHKLNIDLKNVTCWLKENELTLNTFKSKFMLIANSKNLKNAPHFKLQQVPLINCTLVVINEKLSLADHTDFVSKKVNQRLGVLRRIKHLLPNYARNVFASVTVLPFSD